MKYSSTLSHKDPRSDVTQLRAKVDSLNWRHFNAELELDVLQRAITLAKTNLQQIVDERDEALSCINESRVPPQLPSEIILEIAEHLRWDRWYKRDSDFGGDSYSSIRAMANAFSVLDGIEGAILRKIPLVIFESKADSQRAQYERWPRTFAGLPTGQREIIGDDPRFCHIDDEDGISCISPYEEVHLVLTSELHASPIASRAIQKLAGHVHLSLIHDADVNFQDFVNKHLNPIASPRISSLTVASSPENFDIWGENVLLLESPGNAVFERASVKLSALLPPYNFPIPPHLTVFEINNFSPFEVRDLDELAYTLRSVRMSLRSLRFAGTRDVVRAYLSTLSLVGVSSTPIVMDFPCLQELSLETLSHVDLSILMDIARLECSSLTSLIIRTLRVSSWNRVPNLLTTLMEKISCKFPRLQRLAYSPKLPGPDRSSDDYGQDV